MKRIYLLLLLLFPLLTMYKSSNVFAADPPESEYLAAMSAIKEGTYYLVTEVGETKWYVTQSGNLTDKVENACLFAISKDSGTLANSKLYDTAFLIDPGNGAHFSNATPLLDGNAYLHLGFFYQDSGNDRSDWERQVFYLKNGKYAIRTSNTTYGETSWLDAGRVFWSCEPGETDGSIIPCYSYEPAYIWALEEPVGKVKLYLILDDLYTLYENQLYDDVDNPDYVNMGSGYGQYADWVTWRKFKALLENIAELIDNLQDSDYDYESDPNAYTIEQANAMKAEADSLWQKILDSEVLPNDGISFADINVKAICVANWDTNNDGELSYAEAAAVTDLGEVFKSNQEITSFDELKYFAGLEIICDYAFYACESLEDITLPENVTSIGRQAFWNCSSLTSIIIPDNVTSIDFCAFARCSCLSSVKVGSSVTSIASEAFWGCTVLSQFTIPNNTTSIGDYVFSNCRSLISIIIPKGVTNIGERVFDTCNALESIVVDNENTVYDSRNNCNALIETVSNTLIKGCNNTIIPQGIRSIGNYAFFNCTGLASIIIPNSVTTIDDSTFRGCSGLASVTIGTNVTNIGNEAFSGCSGIYIFKVETATPPIVTSSTFQNSNYKNATLYVPNGSKAAYEAADYWKEFKEIIDMGQSIAFEDDNVKAICVANWDTNNDGELSYAEAAAVTDLGEVFMSNQEITSFDELKHFTSLLSISNGAFVDCYGLTSITIPKGVTSMGDYAFAYSGLTNIIIPKGVTSIGERAFFLCNNLTTIVVEEGNTLYDSRNGCNAIIETTSNTLITGCRNTTIPDGVTSIKEDAFYECCLGLTTITIPKSVTSIGNSAFWDCDDLASITIQEGLSNIGDYAFEYCNSLTSVTIPSSVATIGDYAFYSCNNLASVIVLVSQPLPVTENTFSNRANATLYVPAGSKATYEAADYWKDFKEIIDMGQSIAFEDAAVKAICVANWDTNSDGELSYAEAAAVIDLGEVFNNANLEIISFNELQYFTGLTSICEDAFSWCSALTSITIPSSVTSICEDAFEQCSALTSITIPNSVTSVCDYAFSGCSALASITIPSNVTSIGYCAFRGCNSLKSIVVEEGNPVYDSRNNCNALIETASNTLIKGCDNSIIPEGIISIGDIAFGGCTNFTSIIIPNSVKSIGISAFSGCKGLTSITIPNSVTSIDVYAFQNCIGLTSATILNESIGSDMFVGCTSLASVTFSNNLTTIIEAFGGCTSLTSITIPNSVTYISGCAFYGCSGLTHVISEIEEPFAFGNYAFDNISDNCILTVPIGTRDAYIAAGWTEDVFKGGVVEAPEEDTDISQLDNLIYLEATEAKTGSQKVLSIKLKNSAAIRGFQFDLYLPEGVTVAKTSKGKIDGSLSAGRLPDEDEHNLTFSEQTDGAIRFLCSSQYDETFTGTDGEIATLTVNIADNMADGDYPIVLKNMKLTETDISKYYETQYLKSTLTVFSYIIGDINNDGVVDVSDYTGVANHIHGNTPTGFNAHAADVDENGSIDVSDYTGIANIIHTGSIYGAANVRMAIKPKKQKVQEKDPE